MRQLILLLCVLLSVVANAQTVAVYTQEKPVIMIGSNQPEFVIQLKSNPTTGYSWFLNGYDANIVYPVKHVYQAPTNKKLIGASGYELWTFKVKPTAFIVPQRTMIRFVYERPWEAGEAGKSFDFKVVTH